MKSKTSKLIYCDTAATTPVDLVVQKEITKHMNLTYGNAGSIHQIGTSAKQVLENSRKTVSDFLSARTKEIIFTSGGTEANNLAILGVFNSLIKKGNKPIDLHFITTNIEHSSVRETFLHLQKLGCAVDFISVEKTGELDSLLLRKTIKPNTVLVSLAYANSEIGTVQPVHELAKEIRFARKNNVFNKIESLRQFPYFHLDASQATLWLPMSVEKLGVDLMTIDGQKIYGPKGIGALYIKTGLEIESIMFGGKQEKNLRPGTENVPLIAGFAKAVELIPNFQKKYIKNILKTRNYFCNKLKKFIPEIIINGGLENRLPNNINFSLTDSDAEYLLLQLAEKEIICSAKSACLSGEVGSYVVAAVSGTNAARSSLRFTFDKNITKQKANHILKTLVKETIRGGLID
ncbi:MAG: cysteine desulfurase family protein [bacterium]